MNYTNYIERFLNEIKNIKNLSSKTIKAYRFDLNGFINFNKDNIITSKVYINKFS